MFPNNCKIAYPSNYNIKKSKPKTIKTYFWTGGNLNAKYVSEELPDAKPLVVMRLSTMIHNNLNPNIEKKPYYGEDIKGSHNQVNQILSDKLEALADKNEKIKEYQAEIERLKAEQEAAANKNNNNSEVLTPHNEGNPNLNPSEGGN